MAGSGLQKIGIRIILTLMTVLMMGLIFFFSEQSAETSDATSGRISGTVISLVFPDYHSYPAERRQEIYDRVQHTVRKTAHFTEYMILGILLRLCLESWLGKRGFLLPASWAGGTLYACTDEMHQMLTKGRSALWTDVLIDSTGTLCGVLLVLLVLSTKRKARKGTE